EAVKAGTYHSQNWGDYPKIQILTIEELLHGAKVQLPRTEQTFKRAARAEQGGAKQGEMEL
ncbi:MAG: site-specific DNA-methyltransferase, partial [Chloroflexi bacterium]|nr:site-specific DNA-methyltransferase [Chloroflexota bacterium]